MAVSKSTINTAPGFNSSAYTPILWSSFDSGANDVYFDMNGVQSNKLIVLWMGHSTLLSQIWVGTSDSRSSQTSKVYPGSASKLGPLKVRTTLETDGHARSKFQSTVAADTEVFAIYMAGPFEPARFADSQGFIKVARGVTTGGASGSSDELHIAGILVP